MCELKRVIPSHILGGIIESPMYTRPDPKGVTNAYMYYSRIWKNGKLYNAKVLYEKSTNTIYHFLYKKAPLGPLEKVKNHV